MSKKISRRNRRIRNLLLVISMMMVVAMASVGVTVAWLTASTTEIVNTFTTSNITISLSETDTNLDGDNNILTNSYKMVPGTTIAKDPKVGVGANSEACYLFVKLTKSNNFDSFMEYDVASDWEPVSGEANVYYRVVNADTALAGTGDNPYPVLANNTITVKDGVTQTMLSALTDDTRPTLKVRAYACQYANFSAKENAVALAWEAAQTDGSVTTNP